MIIVVALAALFGLAVGSFLNVVVWRVPRGESVVSPPSACPRCGHRIRARHNVPVVGWLVLRGRCHDCGEPIARRYPLVEAATGVAFGLVTWLAGVSWELPALLYLAAISIALALIDLDCRRLPDAVVLPSYAVGSGLLALAAWNPGGEPEWAALLRAGIGGFVLLSVYFLLLVVYPGGMGFGDVKLAGVLGIYLGYAGWAALVVGWFSAFLLGGLYALVLMVAGRAGRRTSVPFGPWMLAGAWAGLLVGDVVGRWYVSLL
ncbi:prepilin peptidase [Cellulomonas uda]|uniref:Prepilin leader peptidase/N-methyltransferase n=1 Tax=Cellulomonas uda TaxID=1714 RepID=A0A4Y3KGY8_CELUD|nr:A24 family peptidase [Cellulomonas uda]GEA82268.1 prepilin peptidase [Cellulomonas uda]